ncbi:MAG: aminotransferase class V-fold PLP-dependent enzyme [Thermoanaerobaculia bacterium]
MRDQWTLDPSVVFLNHGSFGATPRAVLDAQQRWRERLEAEPVRFMVRELELLLDGARKELAEFLGASARDVAFVTNATAGVNAVAQSLALGAGDEIVTTDHEYNACRNVLEFVAARSGTRVVVAEIPLPIRDAGAVVDAIVMRVGPKTRLALVDHITSQTAVIFPVEQIVRALEDRGVPVMIDGAHAPGMLPLDLDALGASYYTGNLHKWVCAPKGAAFLHVRRDLQPTVRPTSISHGANSPRTDRSRFLIEFDWPGTFDPSAWLSVPDALRTVESLVEGGWPEVMRRNRALALRGRNILCEALSVTPLVPDAMTGSMAIVPLPDGRPGTGASALYGDPIQDALLERYGIEVPVIAWPAPPKRLLRISAQLYNGEAEYRKLGEALRVLLEEEQSL